MQVFAQIKPLAPGQNRDVFGDQEDDEDDHNGFQLLNEVESGGTLSSLFTILRLFTEDVRLRYEEAADTSDGSSRDSRRHAMSNDTHATIPSLQLDHAQQSVLPRQRRPSPTSHLQAAKVKQTMRQAASPQSNRVPSQLRNSFSTASSRSASGRSTPNIERDAFPPSQLDSGSLPYNMNTAVDDDDFDVSNTPSHHGNTAKVDSNGPYTNGFERVGRDGRRDSLQTEVPDARHARLPPPLETTIARAKVDATLAVIPAEAFKRLTKKFPKASAHIVQVILTRLHRVTFLTAHEYLGLTKELIKTEKAINELANYPLPAEFYESGGIARLRQRFLPETKAADFSSEDPSTDYFSAEKRKSSFPAVTPYMGPRMGKNMYFESHADFGPEAVRLKLKTSSGSLKTQDKPLPDTSIGMFGTSPSRTSTSPLASSFAGSPVPRARDPTRTLSSHRISRNVGDLLSMTTIDEASINLSTSPERSTMALPLIDDVSLTRPAPRLSSRSSFALGPADAFDLRDAVMTCISKSIGLIQSTVSVPPSLEASPVLHAADRDSSLKRAVFGNSFGSLSYLGLQMRDDTSSMTGSSMTGHAVDTSDIENETEILYFPRESVLAKAGERGPGLFFVIDGWLDVMMPDGHVGGIGKAKTNSEPAQRVDSLPHSTLPTAATAGAKAAAMSRAASRQSQRNKPTATTPPETSHKRPKILFSVKPGGIAGYLSSLSGFPSYVDIVAKTDVYVGFLPAKALERIMDRQPIVLLTLAKRLISLLPPLVVHIDSALEWLQVSAGQVIYRQGEKADSFYFVNQGRLRSIAEKEGTSGIDILAEYGQGDSVGERESNPLMLPDFVLISLQSTASPRCRDRRRCMQSETPNSQECRWHFLMQFRKFIPLSLYRSPASLARESDSKSSPAGPPICSAREQKLVNRTSI